MGTDANIYSKKTKTRRYLDRLSNIELGINIVENTPKQIEDFCDDFCEKLVTWTDIINGVEVWECIDYIKVLKKYRGYQDYLDYILNYLKLLDDNDIVFVVPDSSGFYDEINEIYYTEAHTENNNTYFAYDAGYKHGFRSSVESKEYTVYNGKIMTISEMRDQKIDEILK